MILASAIKYHIESTDKDVVLCGCRHGDIFEQIELLGLEYNIDCKEIEQGFITHDNQFLNRQDAYEHAKNCGQLPLIIVDKRENIGSKSMISEDLW